MAAILDRVELFYKSTTIPLAQFCIIKSLTLYIMILWYISLLSDMCYIRIKLYIIYSLFPTTVFQA